ncbi:hypothetical protein B0H19DRAFT_1258764 [Mycena capillaripes]|nr:hypothetical protein B0H19DRAFT_1258764 [Mycena capillaripes]
MSEESLLNAQDPNAERRIAVHASISNPLSIWRAKRAQGDGRTHPKTCAWCGASVNEVTLYTCKSSICIGGLPACQIWTNGSYWKPTSLRALGYIYQEGHDGLPCPNPTMTTHSKDISTMSGVVEVSRGCNCA